MRRSTCGSARNNPSYLAYAGKDVRRFTVAFVEGSMTGTPNNTLKWPTGQGPVSPSPFGMSSGAEQALNPYARWGLPIPGIILG